MDRRIYGLETEYGLTCSHEGRRTLGPDEAARYLFRRIVARSRSSNVFMENGARLYLDVGNHPEYATAECDTLPDLLAQDKAGDLVMGELVEQAQRRMADDGVEGSIYLFKNNLDSAGNSYGCHENYLLARDGDLARLTEALTPFLLTRQLICGAGKVSVSVSGDAEYLLSQRADVMWEASSSATTRSRPMINTRDEPHADAELYRRLHVIVGDSNMSETTTMLKVGSTDLVLRALEAGATPPDVRPASQTRAIRAVARDLTGRVPLATTSGRPASALDVQRQYRDLAGDHLARYGAARPWDEDVLALWTKVLDALAAGDLDPIATDIDWVIKQRVIGRYAERHGLELGDPRIVRLELSYHDIDPQRGLFFRLQRAGAASRVLTDEAIAQARRTAPATTRAHLRGQFVTVARQHGRDFTVDWSHLRLNDESQRTILCKDPFASEDPRVTRIVARLAGQRATPGNPV